MGAAPRLGKTLAHYTIESHLGSGGMGEVYQARDTRLGRSVAVKFLPAMFAQDSERIGRLEREAKLLASLNHANIASVFGIEEFDGHHFLVMELVPGETLAERVARAHGAMPAEEAVKIALQIAEAVEAAHEKGVIHRDLKLANVKITPGGKVKVLDFGLAKVMERSPTSANLSNSPTASLAATNAGVIFGTAAYMSPEQAKGLNADQRSDIFSFGCILYEMLTGHKAFPGDTVPEILAGVLARQPDLAELPPNLNPRIVDLLRRCLEKNSSRRWQHIGDVRIELAETPLFAAPITSVAGRRRDRVLFAVCSLLLTAAVAEAIWIWQARGPAIPERNVTRFAVPMGVPFDVGRMQAVGSSFPLLEDVATNPAAGDAHFAISETGTVVYVKSSSATALAGNELLWVDRKGSVQRIPVPPRPFEQPRLSPDGQQIAFRVVESNIDIWIYQMMRGVLTRLTTDNGEQETPIWAPGGKRIAFSSVREDGGRTIFSKLSDGSANEQALNQNSETVVHLSSWSQDGKTIAFTVYDPATNGDIWTLKDGEHERKPFIKTPFNEHSGVFSPDGRWMAYTSNESGRDEVYVSAYPGPGGRWQVSTNGGAEPAWSRNGKELFYRNGEDMMVVSVESGSGFTPSTPKQLFQGSYEKEHRNDTNYDVTPDGQRFIMTRAVENGAGDDEINVILDWFSELRRRAAAARVQ